MLTVVRTGYSLNGRLLLYGYTLASGRELWVSDGATSAGTVQIKDIWPLCETDGLIGAETVPTLRPKYRPPMLAELVDKGLWLAHGDVYEIRDYLDQWTSMSHGVCPECFAREYPGVREG